MNESMRPDLGILDIDAKSSLPHREWRLGAIEAVDECVCRQFGIYTLPKDFLLSVVIPIYNEEATLRKILSAVMSVPIPKEIVLVDDCSSDDSPRLLKAIAAEVRDKNTLLKTAFHDSNRGKGAALRTGFALTTGDAIVVQDADLEYDPREFSRLLQPIVEGRADVVYGSRFLGGQPHRVLYFWHYVGNRALTTLSNCFTNLNLTDMETCYKVFSRRVLDDVLPTLKQDRFGFEPEVTAKIARRNYAIYEMSISYYGRTYAEGKKIGMRDAWKALWCILRYAWRD
jgi:glycosyltransferase involved in cell wall biosynthesis